MSGVYNYPRRGPFRSAWQKGYDAYMRGDLTEDCPYVDWRTRLDQVTFSRAFINAWNDGYMAAEHEPQGTSAQSGEAADGETERKGQ